MESLRFDQIDARQMNIKSAHAKTCKWLLNSSQYIDWLDASKTDEHHGFLWIKGKAGAGKSTLMKFATVNARKTMKGSTVLTFFFNARGEEIEKSTIGTYRSLLLQLLEAFPESHSIFSSTGISTLPMNADRQWSLELLKTLLEQAIQSLGHSSVVCFIDALDECEEDQVREMIQFLERISGIAVSNGLCFKVCFSSRHYPHVTISNGLELVLEGHEGHAQDITNYIETELKIGKTKAAQRIRSELQEKASGVFMWVVLVVDILNKDFDRGQVHALQKKLQEIPSNLHELFRNILTRDSRNKELLILCIQWVLFARKPLSPQELYHALLSSVDPEAVADWDPDDVTTDDMKRYILSSSKGLTEATAGKYPRVQFIHESVRDFLLKEKGLSKIWPEYEDNFYGQSHERLKQSCHDYISLAAAFVDISKGLAKASARETAAPYKLARRLWSFLEYAIDNVFYHADIAEGSGISQKGFLDNFSIPEWVRFENLFEIHKVRRHTQHVSLLYLLAEFDMANLIKALDSASQCMIVEPDRYGCPLFAAAALKSEKALKLFMQSIRARSVEGIFEHMTDVHESRQLAVQCPGRRDFSYSKRKDFLLCAAELGLDGIIPSLVESRRFDINSFSSENRSPLWWASRNGCELGVRALLSAGSTTINIKDRHDKSPLFAAAGRGSRAVVEMLLDSGAEIDYMAKYDGTALCAASREGHRDVVVLLLDRGADIDMGNPLGDASFKGHKDIVKLLVDRGAKIDCGSGHRHNAIEAASSSGKKEILELLLEKGADVNMQSALVNGALRAAVRNGHIKIVELLLDEGANVNARDSYHGAALQTASAHGHKGIVELLLNRGADIHEQSERFGNALLAASIHGKKAVVEVLLKNGAIINTPGAKYSSALEAASLKGHDEIVRLLKEWNS